jgi:hypothetical protein
MEVPSRTNVWPAVTVEDVTATAAEVAELDVSVCFCVVLVPAAGALEPQPASVRTTAITPLLPSFPISTLQGVWRVGYAHPSYAPSVRVRRSIDCAQDDVMSVN